MSWTVLPFGRYPATSDGVEPYACCNECGMESFPKPMLIGEDWVNVGDREIIVRLRICFKCLLKLVKTR